jgi:hypothetical protein
LDGSQSLFGDLRQNRAIEAGKPFKPLEERVVFSSRRLDLNAVPDGSERITSWPLETLGRIDVHGNIEIRLDSGREVVTFFMITRIWSMVARSRATAGRVQRQTAPFRWMVTATKPNGVASRKGSYAAGASGGSRSYIP